MAACDNNHAGHVQYADSHQCVHIQTKLNRNKRSSCSKPGSNHRRYVFKARHCAFRHGFQITALLLLAASIVGKLTPAETMHNCRTFSPPPTVVRIPSPAVTQSLTGRQNIYDSKYNFTESNSSICSIAIILSGDIQANPSPTKFPCGICQQPMAKSHRAMGCDECGRWIHIKCCGINPKQYVKYQSETNCTWLCPTCSLPNFTDSFFQYESLSTDNSFNSISSPSESEEENSLLSPLHQHRRRTRDQPLKVTTINVNSISSQNKRGLLYAYIDHEQPDIIITSEAQVDNSILDRE